MDFRCTFDTLESVALWELVLVNIPQENEHSVIDDIDTTPKNVI